MDFLTCYGHVLQFHELFNRRRSNTVWTFIVLIFSGLKKYIYIDKSDFYSSLLSFSEQSMPCFSIMLPLFSAKPSIL